MPSMKERAKALNHSSGVIDLYEQLKERTKIFNNDHVSELDTIYFLSNILWGGNIELMVEIIKERGYEFRIKQIAEQLGYTVTGKE